MFVLLFFEMGQPQPLHRRDAYDLFLFDLFNKERRKVLQQSYKLKQPPNTGVKVPPN
jgi:hypothetical protein